ncbi:MAG: hypothetical protein HUU37_09560 [Bdellovibrionales bacterium]|nr:hypothetical protein [Bdellovibrionales bacterium]
MKKFARTLAILAVAAAIPAFASVDALNEAVKGLLAPFNNPETVAELKFDNVEVDAERALRVKAGAMYRKVGKENVLEVKVDEVSYDYGDGTAPTTTAKGSIALNLLKLISQKDINEFAPALEDMVADFAKNAGKGYGDALEIEAKVLDKQVTDAGDLVSISIRLAGKLDLSKLPADKPANEEVVTSGAMELTVGVNGASVNFSAISNPGYKGFQSDQVGLKELLEKLLSLDAEMLEKLQTFFTNLDGFAGKLVDMKGGE